MKQPITYDDLLSIVDPLVIDQESDELEYKTALGGFPQSFWETYSSFANTKNVLVLLRHQLLTLASAATDEAVSNEYLQFVLGIHRGDISAMLHTMCKNQLLISEGHGKGTIYYLPSATLDSNVTTSGSNVTTSDANVTTSRHKRMSLEQRQQMILDFCSDWRNLEEIAAYLHVRKEHVRARLLPTMEHILDRKYPIPHHPRQRYRRKDASQQE